MRILLVSKIRVKQGKLKKQKMIRPKLKQIDENTFYKISRKCCGKLVKTIIYQFLFFRGIKVGENSDG